ncbi:PH domain-containing protein [Actinomadura latina]|uniref:PH domain-containing protein n=1 Tax=Actinomadura latina TaxID=163603 RepID=A0A846YSU2_9ACTN|nr:PH domain-containing protein [Actinomadura latina]NKZ02827.1 PH domain-containing protein [Actinomadura latina]
MRTSGVGAGPGPAEFGPGTAQRWAWGVAALLLAGGVAASTLLLPDVLLVVLVSATPLAPIVVGGLVGRMRPPTSVAQDGIRCHAVFSVQLRRQFVPWPAIARVDVRKRGRRAFAMLQLTDGGRIVLQHPAGRRVHEAVAFMQRQHLAACGGRPPAVDRVPLPWRRLRIPVRVVAVALPVAGVAGLVAWMSAEAGGMRSPDDVAACDQIPRQVVTRILPEGSAHGYGNRAACRWSGDSTRENATWIDFHIGSWTPSHSERSYQETLKAMRAAGRTPHLLRDGDAYTMAWRDSWGFTAHGRAHVKGYLVVIALHSGRAASVDEAERQAAAVLRAVLERLA